MEFILDFLIIFIFGNFIILFIFLGKNGFLSLFDFFSISWLSKINGYLRAPSVLKRTETFTSDLMWIVIERS